MWLQKLRTLRLPILYYHEIGPDRSKYVVHPQDFVAQLDWLRSEGHAFLTLDEVLDLYAGRRAPPRTHARADL